MKKTDDNNSRQPDLTAALSITGKRPELLAPAGELAGVIGAINAGADAVYLGAEAFSARAYAKNLSSEELIEALDYAHAFDRKIYLACNILLRDHELERIPKILDPLYEQGLDGIIVQDLGLLSFLHKRYPALPLHASTQMSILTAEGAEWLKRMQVSRVVPGRELSLKELKLFKARGIEVECFIHGAMCYSYSGRCLLSSFAGGRSGNRGRCAGPCRQPYRYQKGQACYPLSLKDMWSLHNIGELIDAGIDSFKIEGRMKAPEYTAGVTAVYRKYIDQYLQNGQIHVSPKDEKRLEDLYLRSGKQEGYLHQHNGKDMVSVTSPAYGKVSEEEKKRVSEKYLAEKKAIPVEMHARIFVGEPLQLTVQAKGQKVIQKGAPADAASKRAMSSEQFAEKFSKTGGTLFSVSDCYADTDDLSFVPVSALNDLRRNALDKLKKKLLPYRADLQAGQLPVSEFEKSRGNITPVLRIGLRQTAALQEVLACSEVEGVILDTDLFAENAEALCRQISSSGKKMYLRLPAIIREKDVKTVRECLAAAVHYDMEGIYVNGVDALAIAEDVCPDRNRIGDAGFYVFNQQTEQVALKYLSGYTVSLEKSGKEYRNLAAPERAECVIYGYLPVMYSANCVMKTLNGCDRTSGVYEIADEKGHVFPIIPEHRYCYNTMYNCVPLSLHAELPELREQERAGVYRLEFTIEDRTEIRQILKAYCGLWSKGEWNRPFAAGQTTRGHFLRGAE